MLKQVLKLALAVMLTAILGLALNTGLGYVTSQWTAVSMEQARHNMGDQVALRMAMNAWRITWWATLLTGLAAIGSVWYFMYRKWFKTLVVAVVMILSLAACSTRVVLITPPNYGIVISLSNTENQATGNNFDQGQLLNVTQQEVKMVRCAANSPDMCPDKIVVEVQGSPESRIYSADSNSGTSENNQSLTFEANGANGTVDFSITAIILKEDAKCYANKMGVDPVKEADGTDSVFHFRATPLAEALDTRVIQIASSRFALKVASTSPLELALTKFALFEEIKPDAIKAIHDQTCITITDMSINGGIQWSPEIQEQINQATVIANQLELVALQNELAMIQTQAFIERALAIEQEFGLAAAIEFMRIQKWDGTYLPALPGSPAVTPTVPVETPAPTNP